MSNTFGKQLKLSIFGESHGKAVGGVIDGLPPGLEIDMEALRIHMARRMPGRSKLSTPRKELDEVNILSGYFNGSTTGTPLAFIIENKDTREQDYEKIRYLLRPGHADYTAYAKYQGFHDYRGSGSFSGRLTASLNFAGGIAMQILEARGIYILSHAFSIGQVKDFSFSEMGLDVIRETEPIRKLRNSLRKKTLPVLEEDVSAQMVEEILHAKEEEDSVGGIVEVGIFGLPFGAGDNFFDSVESRLAHLCFSIPSIKGIEFGEGFGITKMRGSQSNDEMELVAGGQATRSDEDIRSKLRRISHKTNRNGGVIGGITNAMPVIFRAAVKPTASIGKTQRTVNLQMMREMHLTIKGRHDPCIVPRVIPVIESAAAFCVLDILMGDMEKPEF